MSAQPWGRTVRPSSRASILGGGLTSAPCARYSWRRSSKSFSVIAQLLAQAGQPAGEVAPRCPGAATHQPGALVQAVSVVVVEDDHRALLGRQLPVGAVQGDVCGDGRTARR